MDVRSKRPMRVFIRFNANANWRAPRKWSLSSNSIFTDRIRPPCKAHKGKDFKRCSTVLPQMKRGMGKRLRMQMKMRREVSQKGSLPVSLLTDMHRFFVSSFYWMTETLVQQKPRNEIDRNQHSKRCHMCRQATSSTAYAYKDYIVTVLRSTKTLESLR